MAEGDFIDSWPITTPAANNWAGGITTDGTNIWFTSTYYDSAYKYDMSGGYITSWSLHGENTIPEGITTDGTNIWVSDTGFGDVVYKYDMSGGYIGSWLLTAANTFPHGMATDGTNIWVVDRDGARVYK
ncbi:unnamed protein product, partial [marine sediment metagenome]